MSTDRIKKIVIASVNKEPMLEYKTQLEGFFGDFVKITEYAYDSDEVMIECDLVVNLTPTLHGLTRELVKSHEIPIVAIQTSLTKKQMKLLCDFEEGTTILVISAFRFYAKECVEIFAHTVKNNLNYIPYYTEMINQRIPNVDVGIYVGDESIKPDFLDHYINIGWKGIHPQSLDEIINILFNDHQILKSKLSNYRKKMSNIDFSELMAIKLRNESRIELRGLISVSDKGIIILDQFNRIVDYNHQFADFFNLELDVYEGKKIHHLELFKELNQSILRINDHVETDCYVESLDKTFRISKETIRFQYMSFSRIIKIERIKGAENISKNSSKYSFEDIHFVSESMAQCIRIGKKIARNNSPIMIMGETGTGKELFANAIHNESHRRNKPFFAVNCTAFQDNLLESELFGYEAGSFTGALRNGKMGIFEIANGGTVFLDEIGDAPLSIQVKLLRVIQEQEIRRIGGMEIIPVDVRIVSATNKNLKELIKENLFREDLYYRLNTFILKIPALRERKDDIGALIIYYLKHFGYSHKIIENSLVEYLKQIPWNGNIRELRNCVEYLGFMSDHVIDFNNLPEQYKKIEAVEAFDNNYVMSSDYLGINQKEACINMFILEKLSRESMGRKRIYEMACAEALIVTEHRIRKSLKQLEEKGLVKLNTGRIGCEITTDGRKICRSR